MADPLHPLPMVEVGSRRLGARRRLPRPFYRRPLFRALETRPAAGCVAIAPAQTAGPCKTGRSGRTGGPAGACLSAHARRGQLLLKEATRAAALDPPLGQSGGGPNR